MDGIADFEFLRGLGSGPHGEIFRSGKPPRLPVRVEHVAVKVFRRKSTSDGFRRATASRIAAAAPAL